MIDWRTSCHPSIVLQRWLDCPPDRLVLPRTTRLAFPWLWWVPSFADKVWRIQHRGWRRRRCRDERSETWSRSRLVRRHRWVEVSWRESRLVLSYLKLAKSRHFSSGHPQASRKRWRKRIICHLEFPIANANRSARRNWRRVGVSRSQYVSLFCWGKRSGDWGMLHLSRSCLSWSKHTTCAYEPFIIDLI